MTSIRTNRPALLPKLSGPKTAAAAKPVTAAKAKAKDEFSTGLGKKLRLAALKADAAPMGPASSKPAKDAAKEPKPTPGEQAAKDYEAIKAERTGKLSTWDHADAAEFTDAIADQVEAHKDDPEYVKALLTLAAPRLERSAQLLGDAADEKFEDSRGDIEALASNFSRIGNAAPPEQAAQLAYGLASEVSDHGEQRYFDDGFTHFIEDGGDATFRNLLHGALEVQGKEAAADELVEGAPGIVESVWSETGGRVVDGIGDLAGFFGELATEGAAAAWDFGGDLVGAVVDGGTRLIGETVDFAIDAAEGTLDFAGELANATAEQVGEAVKWAAEKGYQLSGEAKEATREFVDERLEATLEIEERVSGLETGDSYTFGGKVTAGVGVGGDLGGGVTVTNTGEGFDVTATVEGDVFLGRFASAGGAAQVSYHFDTAEEAAAAARVLARQGIVAGAGAAGPVLAEALGPTESERGLLDAHHTSTAAVARVGASLDTDLDVPNPLGLPIPGMPPLSQLEASATASGGFRVEYDANGKEEYLVRTASLQLSENTNLDQLPAQVKDALEAQYPDLELSELKGSVTVTLESKVKIDGEKLGDEAIDLTNPLNVPVLTGTGETTVMVDVVASHGAEGISVHLEAQNVEAGQLAESLGGLATAEGFEAFAGLSLSGSMERFRDEDRAPDLDLFVTPGFGVDVDLTNRVRDVTEHEEISVSF